MLVCPLNELQVAPDSGTMARESGFTEAGALHPMV